MERASGTRPASGDKGQWPWNPEAELVSLVRERFEKRLENYKNMADEVREHHGNEVKVLAGGYTYRQVLELVQNAADAILEHSGATGSEASGRVVLRLFKNRLYAANTGAPFSKDGIKALLSADSSPKRQNQIGRFGLGFKSLLGLEGQIDVFSRSICFRFDPARCAETIRDHVSFEADAPAPGLRLAWPIDAAEEFDTDPVLFELSGWAATIVRVDIGTPLLVSRVDDELDSFPGEFLLFLAADVELELLSDTGIGRSLSRRVSDKDVCLVENDKETPWKVASIQVPLDDDEAIQKDATEVHKRDEVPITWALPLAAEEEQAGKFWAFFPTESPSRVPGILNAPWKVNSDRTALIPGAYNTFLMKRAATLIAANLESLATADDPGRPLDVFPREPDSSKEIAKPLVDALWDCLTECPVVPDGAGVGRQVSSLLLHPLDDEEAVRLWRQIATPKYRAAFVHPACYRGARLTRLKKLASRTRRRKDRSLPVERWLECVASTAPTKAQKVLHIVNQVYGSLRGTDRRILEKLRDVRLIPTDQKTLVSASTAVIGGGVVPTGKFAVHKAVVADERCRQILEDVLGVRSLDDRQWRAILDQALEDAGKSWHWNRHEAWDKFWTAIGEAPSDLTLSFVDSVADRIHLRSISKEWRIPARLLRAGGVVSSQPELSSVLLDEDYHASHKKIVERLQIQPEPPKRLLKWTAAMGEMFSDYRTRALRTYRRKMSLSGQRPQESYLNFLDDARVLAGAPLLKDIPESSRRKLTLLLLEQLSGQSLQPASFGHETQREKYETIEVPSPSCWLLASHGVVTLAGHSVTIRDLVAALDLRWTRSLPGWIEVLDRVEKTLTKGFPGEWEAPAGDLGTLWPAVFAACESGDVSWDLRRTCYAAAAEHGEVPQRVTLDDRTLPLEECYVTGSEVVAKQVRKAALPVVLLAEETIDLWVKKGARNMANLSRVDHDELEAQPVSLLDVAPDLAPALGEEAREAAWVQVCKNLRIVIDTEKETPLPAAFERGSFLVDLEQLERCNWRQRIEILLTEAVAAGWVDGDAERLKRELLEQNYLRRRAEVAQKPTIVERLLAAVGGNSDVLLQAFDGSVRHAMHLQKVEAPPEVAGLALAVHGPAILARLRDKLEEEGLKPPTRWGTEDAYEFAIALGFPSEFGGSRKARRSAELLVSGPMPLGALHDYQERLIGDLGTLIEAHKRKPARAVLSLPTGSGKTRVAVETAVNTCLNKGSTVLWIAQTDELCEQAVQSFRQVWVNRGKEWTDLRLVRLWGGNPSPVASDRDVPTVIVASIQTLVSRIAGRLPDWLRAASLVVIDEAHHAIAPSYTRLLTWLTGKETRDGGIEAPPLLGLSATPFRGRDEVESRRLARRFNGELYPPPGEQADLYGKLQADGMLSDIAVKPLVYDRAFVLTDEEKRLIDTFDEFPDAAARRMGEDERRNTVIVRSIESHTKKGQALFFANSVWHASHVAALLHMSGVKAAVVHGETEASARQYFVRQFQSGDIDVLCNYGVLTTGFDAPRTHVIVISRPVFSPVRYMQMVGRGLRGEKNGGTKTCTVVTVLDNIMEYSKRLAYHTYFTRYFQN